ncbi:MAG TPA: S9 family peptidase [Archangium sp.]|jgi:dipeptidyl aminopeptidase/acylaminoacyl peptidase|uniref:S9 family peptidase n=1 Tax=Archangium sp. TaxID=1872627 RepID=UPI002ED95597
MTRGEGALCSGADALGRAPGDRLSAFLPGASPRRISASAEASFFDEHDLAWSPEGKQLAFLSNVADKKQPQLHVADATTGTARRLTAFHGSLSTPRWSPDGKSLAVLVIEGTTEEKGPTGPASRQTGVVDEHAPARRIALVSAADGRLRVLSPANLFVHEFSWSPDGKRFAFIASPPPGDANWWTAKLYTLDSASGASRVVHTPRLQLAEPTWSPDGKQLAFIEGLMSDEGVNGGDVFVLPATGGTPRNVTPGLKASATQLHWPSPDKLLFTAHAQGELAVLSVHPARGTPAVLWKGPERISAGSGPGLSLARDGVTSAVLRESYSQPPEVLAGPVGAWVPLTRRNAEVKSPAVTVKSLSWKSDALDVQGWLIVPPGLPEGARAPMVTIAHGGPAGASAPAFSQQVLLLASQGYYVFLPNPRGSFGQGEAFTEANRRDFGHGDLRDILTGVDAVLVREPVDGARLGLTGWSYGGFMTMWAVTQTQRFRAAVAGAGISNWQSYYGTNRIDTWMLPFFGASVYDDPALYARSSPINFIKQVRTPTLVVHGERDSEVPASQGFEFWKALKTLGVETQLVVYPDEGHGLRKPEHQRDRLRRTVAWFDAHLAPPPAPKAPTSPR